MARPQKTGLDYFPLDVDMDQDDKVALIEAKHNITGFAVYTKLLMKIYKEGYFYKWTEREQLLFSSRINVDINIVTDIVNDCIKWDLFAPALYEKYQILTSCGIQRRYIEAIKRRKEVTLIYEYLIIESPDEGDNFRVKLVNVDPKTIPEGVNEDINPLNGGVVEELIPKGEERKGNKSKGNNSTLKTQYAESVTLAETEYEKLVENHGKADTDQMIVMLNNYKLAHGKEYESDFHAILTWVAKKVAEEKKRTPVDQAKLDGPKKEW